MYFYFSYIVCVRKIKVYSLKAGEARLDLRYLEHLKLQTVVSSIKCLIILQLVDYFSLFV